MLQEEFEKRYGAPTSAENFAVINKLYMNTDLDKDRFVKDWKKTPEEMQRAVINTVAEYDRKLAEKNEEIQKLNAYTTSLIGREDEETARLKGAILGTLLDSFESAIAYQTMTMQEIVKYKIEKGLTLTVKDADFIIRCIDDSGNRASVDVKDEAGRVIERRTND